VVFEEEYHGAKADMEDETMSLDKADSLDSASGASVEEEEIAKKV
jgi:Skp family chaperone for outer membrane proteins